MAEPSSLLDGFQWVRPYHQIAKDYVPCQHHITAAFSTLDKRAIAFLKKYPDSVAFVDDPQERYQNVQVKDIRIVDEYYCNLKNSALYICQGQTSFLADAFYNGKYALIFPDYEDAESITNSQLAQKIGIGRILTFADELPNSSIEVEPACSGSIKYLHEHIEEL
jgi:UDP:flavonoid glycosyltransferase YjiC (YdhE family)